MAPIWTHGVWTVKPGHEDEFVAAWRSLLPLGEQLGAGQPTLLRDCDQPNVFRTFGPFPDLETVHRFREQIASSVADVRPLLDGFEAFTLDEVYPGG